MAKGNKAQAATAAAPAAANDLRNRMPQGAIGEEVDSGDVDVIVKFNNEGDEFMGRYRGYKKTKSGKPNVQSTLHKFETFDGDAIGVWGSYQLDAKLAKIADGEWCWIMYLGKQQLAGGNEMHNYKVVRVERPSATPAMTATVAQTDETPF